MSGVILFFLIFNVWILCPWLEPRTLSVWLFILRKRYRTREPYKTWANLFNPIQSSFEACIISSMFINIYTTACLINAAAGDLWFFFHLQLCHCIYHAHTQNKQIDDDIPQIKIRQSIWIEFRRRKETLWYLICCTKTN